MQFKSLLVAAFASAAAAQSLTEALNASTDLSALNGLLGQFPDLAGQLASLSNITILAPNNDAINAVVSSPEGAAIVGDAGLVQAILQYHVLQGTYANFTENATFVPTSLNNQSYTNVTGGQVVEGSALDGNVTIFSGLKANSSVVRSANFTGGVIHVIDSILTLPTNISSTAVALNLTSIVGALTAAELVEAVDTTPDLTVFVPNNEAFQSIGSALPNLTTEEVTAILTYHVIEGTVAYSSSLVDGMNVTTMQGNNLTISIQDDGDVFVNGARVVIADVLVANGVVHVIDDVLNPNNATAAADDANEGSGAFEGASSASDVPYTSGVATPTSSIATESIAATASSTGGGAKQTGLGAAAMLGAAGLAMLL